jgi:serine protease
MGQSKRLVALGLGLGLALLTVGSAAASGPSVPGREIYMPTRGMVEKAIHAQGHKPGGSKNLYYHGGVGGLGVETGSDTVYLVAWGSGWSSDPSGEVALLQSFFLKVGGSSWNNSVTQYCQGGANGSTTCGSGTTKAANPAGVYGGTWTDTTNAAPAHPSQSDLAAEAGRAATYFGVTAANHGHVQFDILTATGHNASGAGSSYCAWHSSTSSGIGTIAYTNMPYVTDYGASCGANFNGLGANAGITIVNGHEFAETESDIYPNGGWLDSGGAENGDKCAWISSGQGASALANMGGTNFPVQSLWSNAFNSNAGGCVLAYP